MNQKYRVLSGVGIAVVTILALSGCATNSPSPSSTPTPTSQTNATNAAGVVVGSNSNSTASNNTVSNPSGNTGNTTNATTNSTTNQTSPATNNTATSTVVGANPAPQQSVFPAIINMAMNSFSASTLTDAKAPTTLPLPASSSNQLFYKTAHSATPIMSHPGLLSSYSVTLSSPKHQIADFSGHRYDTSAHAGQTMSYALMSASLKGSQSSVSVGNKHLQAVLAVDTKSSTSMIGWTEGSWTIRVTNSDGTSIPTSAANLVAYYLDTHFMPIPHDKGLINVVTGKSGTVVVVTWQENNLMFETDATAYAYNPITTALAMAISMKNYH